MPTTKQRFEGALLGLATGDALGVPVAFKSPGQFPAVQDMLGGGIFKLAPGQWTKHTSMALCVAESFVETRSFNPADQLERYLRWWRTGHMSSTSTCFDIDTTMKAALRRFEKNPQDYSGLTSFGTAGNGSLARIVAIPLVYAQRPQEALEKAALSSRTTHAAIEPLDACRYLSALILGALRGQPKKVLLAPYYTPVPNIWQDFPLVPAVDAVVAGSFSSKMPPDIRAESYVVTSLEAALWAFYQSNSFEEGALLAVNLGEDAEAVGAIYGQLAGAYYGTDAIPGRWLERLSKLPLLQKMAQQLFNLAKQTTAVA
jgi:ADP-ribosylglycohydrolase